ncbi:hypothetical protein [Staphylococcus felis]|uniref:hypothetical protein n=1 Tax=Staphylococcus felis TaxID=46127 RepID=UPI003966EAC0
MKILEILGTLFGIGIVVLPLAAISLLVYELTKAADSRSFVAPVICILLFIICGIGLVIIGNVLN